MEIFSKPSPTVLVLGKCHFFPLSYPYCARIFWMETSLGLEMVLICDRYYYTHLIQSKPNSGRLRGRCAHHKCILSLLGLTNLGGECRGTPTSHQVVALPIKACPPHPKIFESPPNWGGGTDTPIQNLEWKALTI